MVVADDDDDSGDDVEADKDWQLAIVEGIPLSSRSHHLPTSMSLILNFSKSIFAKTLTV